MAKSKKKEPTYFQQQVFTKQFEGVKEYGIILRQKFYPLTGFSPGEYVQLKETSEHDTRYGDPKNLDSWLILPRGRPI